MKWLILLLLLFGSWSSAQAGTLTPRAANPHALCEAAIASAERTLRLPSKLLVSIGTVESGKRDPVSGRVTPWPWTINVAGAGYFFQTKQEAIEATERHRALGIQSIDVGCMQVNLMHHAGAFASLDHAFDPQANATYSASFLSRLRAELGDWPKAAAAYHSRTPDLAAKYLGKVFAVWPLASQYGGAVIAISARTAPALEIDPYKVYTGEFAKRRLQDARDRAARDASQRWEQPRARGTRATSTGDGRTRSFRSAQAG